MADVELTMSVIPSSLTRPVISGQIPVEGVKLQAADASSVNANSMRMLKLDFDIGEMSFATFAHVREQGLPLVALPLFTGRRFLQPAITVARSAGIREVPDLRGKRVGLPQYWMTSSVWHRIVLRQMYGIEQNEIRWVTTAGERMGTLGYPPGVDVRLDDSGRSPNDLMLAGEIEASMSAGAGARDTGPQAADAAVIRAFPDLVAAQRAYHAKTGIFPIMHMIVMKEEVAKQHPGVANALCQAFEQAKGLGLEKAMSNPNETPIAGGTAEQGRDLLGADPWPFSISANAHVLTEFLAQVHHQGLTQKNLTTGDLFAPGLAAQFA